MKLRAYSQSALGMTLVLCRRCGKLANTQECAECWQASRRAVVSKAQQLGRATLIIDEPHVGDWVTLEP
jgi:ribosomal protein L37E